MDSPARPSPRVDLSIVVAITALTYAASSIFEIQEWLAYRLMRLERWQLDELPMTLLVLAAGLAWYSMRRRRDAEAQLRLRVRAEAHVAHLLQNNRELAQQLISVQESERVALARELHDEFGQSCAAIRAETAYMRHCAAGDRAELIASAGRADGAAEALYLLVRNMLSRLRPADLDSLGLSAALQALCDGWSERNGIPCALLPFAADPAGTSRRVVEDASSGLAPLWPASFDALGDTLDITIYRVAQEALTNASRHADASRVDVRLHRTGPDIVLTVEDDGNGMDTGAVTRGLGLLGAVERAAAVGGELTLTSSPGGGVKLALRIPAGASR